MSRSALDDVPGRNTPVAQTEQARPDQVANSAGGFVFQVDDLMRLRRWLILGSEGGSFYVGQRDLTLANVEALDRCLANAHRATVEMIVEISVGGLAIKNDQAIFALAKAASTGDVYERAFALEQLPLVCRIGTHLFQFVEYAEKFRGWGPQLRNAVGNWYLRQDPMGLQVQLAKYGQRDGWSQADVLRLAKPRPERGSLHDRALGWAVNRAKDPAKRKEIDLDGLELLDTFARLHSTKSKAEMVKLIEGNSRVSWEMVPSDWLKEPEIWEALLPHLGLTALIRNLGRLTSIGLIGPFQAANRAVCIRLTEQDAIMNARVHPMQFLLARGTYSQGHGDKGSLSWTPATPIVEALDEGFLKAFKAVTPSGKRTLLALDVSGSMDGAKIAGTPISAREASAAMAMVTVHAEPHTEVVAFSDLSGHPYGRGPALYTGGRRVGRAGSYSNYDRCLTPMTFSRSSSLREVVEATRSMPFAGTDCALPALWAKDAMVDVDTIVIYTDNETWAGAVHPYKALEQLRQHLGHDVKQVVVSMVPNQFSIADPNDRSSLDVVGFDASAPRLISDFSAGLI